MVKGKKVGKYELGKTLGSGSFSKVKLGVDDAGRQYAVKIIEKEQLVREHMEEQLKREISVMKLLKHPHCVQLFDVLQTQNHIYLVLELVTGGELFDRILSAKRFDEDTGRRFFQQMVVALHYCHRNGVAHRDLKPENLLLDGDGNIKISDFGLANLTNNTDDLMSTVCGTPNYVAPEVIRDQGYNGFAADVWSCGIILYVMMSGHQAFDDPNVKALFNKIERGEYQMSRYFTDGAKDLISKILVVDASRRYTINQIIAHPWFQVGFDPADLAHTEQVIDVSAEQKNSALQTVDDPRSPVDDALGGGASGDDAFALCQRMMGATLGTLGKSNPIPAASAPAASPNASAQPLAGCVRGMLYRGKAESAVKDIQAALKPVTNVSVSKSERTTELKGFVSAKRGLVTFVIEVTPTVVPTLTLIEAKKGRGDVLDFGDLITQIHQLLPGKLASTPTM